MKRKTSWERDSAWYSRITRGKGQYYHERLVIPNAIRLLKLGKESVLLDVACGSGVLGRAVPATVNYTGADISPSLIGEAKRTDKNPSHRYAVCDVVRGLPEGGPYNRAAVILALQNISDPERVIRNVSERMDTGGVFVIVLNHPAFRIPRQSSWEIDPQNKLQYRKVNRYLSPLEIPVTMHPGKSQSSVTWSYHRPISAYSDYLDRAGFVIKRLEEWSSDKTSKGSARDMENMARSEFPLFLALQAIKMPA